MQKPLTQFNSITVQQFKDEFAQKLKEIGDDYGVRFIFQKGRYSDNCYSIKLECHIENVVTALKTVGQLQFERNCMRQGLQKSDFGRSFNFNGSYFKIIGWVEGSRKYPVVCENTTTKKRMRFTSESVRKGLS